MKDIEKDPFVSIATPLVALSLFYTILFVLLDSKIEGSELWKQIALFTILLITFYFTIAVFVHSRGQNEYVQVAGLLLFIFWWVVYFYLSKLVVNMASYLFSSITDFGLAWLIIIPLLSIPAFSLFYFKKKYACISKLRYKIIYWLATFDVAGGMYLLVKSNHPNILSWIFKMITYIPSNFVNVFLTGSVMGIIVALMVSPAYPLLYNSLFNIIVYLSNILNFKKKEIK